MKKIRQSSRNSANIFVFVTFVFGLLSCFLTFPLSNGDEGYHLSQSYLMFSSDRPKQMEEAELRDIEMIAIQPNRNTTDFDINTFYLRKIDSVSKDGYKVNFLKDKNFILKIDFAHLPAAIGVLLGRIIYPSYGVMMLFGRLSNLIFFCIGFYLIIKRSNVGKWSLLLLFTIPFIQKMSSLSYDVYCYVFASAFLVELLNQLKLLLEKKKINLFCLIFLTIMVFFCKKNYIVLFFGWLILGLIYLQIEKVSYRFKVYIGTGLMLLILMFGFLYYIDGVNFVKIFINSYLNTVTMQRRALQLFNVVSVILPDIFNLIWFIALTIVFIGETNFQWNKTIITSMIALFLINWFVIYTGFYFILGKPDHAFDDLSGRYLYPFIICFLPLAQRFSYINKICIKEKSLQVISVTVVSVIYFAYLVTVFYRGFIVGVTPTWR